MKLLYCVFIFGLLSPLFSEDGGYTHFDSIEMNINDENYILFEDESLIVCDRKTGKNLVEITFDFDLFIYGKKLRVNEYQKDLLQEYYIAQYILFTKRNRIASKGLEIGLDGVKLAAKAVGGAFMLIAAGFDEEQEKVFEEEMERESESIERKAEIIEYHAEEFEEQVKNVNRAERILTREIKELNDFALYVQKDEIGNFNNRKNRNND
jgi:hypothetical protein